MSITLVYHLLKLLRNQWLRKEELDQIQQRKLKKIIKRAYEKVNYYHKLFDSTGIKPEDIRSKEDLQYIPITSRTQIQSLTSKEIVAQGVRLSKCHHIKTSGSTGVPLEIIKTEKEYQLSNLVMMRSLFANGYRLTDRGAIIEIPISQRRYWFQCLGIIRRKLISAFDNPDSQIRQLREVKPDFIGGLPSRLRAIAEELRRRDIKDISPRTLVTGGEVLDSETREVIESAFRPRIVDFYSCSECGNIAWECDCHEGYHINVDSLVIEIIKGGKPAKPGEKGDVIITSLDSYAMPFIRYAIGDTAMARDGLCSCGRELPLLEAIEGRSHDLVVLSNGNILSPFELTCVLECIPGVLQFKVIQKEVNQFVLQLKVEPNSTKGAVIRKATKEMTRILGKESNIDIEIVREIPRDPSGKIRAVISHVKQASNKGL